MSRQRACSRSARFSFCLSLALGSTSAVLGQSPEVGRPYWVDNWRGWHFYEELESPAPAPQASAPRQATPASSAAATLRRTPAKPPEIVEFERLQKALDERRQIAIMRPTEVNVRRYMELEAQVVAQASTFADVAQRIAWANPDLDPTLQGRPVNARALEVFDQLQTVQRRQSISALGRDHVLFFFFRSDCPYCHAFAPTLEAFQARHGVKVVAISVDGGPIPGFADARRDNGIATTLHVSQVPAVYLVQPFSGRITPIGFGVLSEAQLVERISMVAATPDSTVVPMLGGMGGLRAQLRLPVSR